MSFLREQRKTSDSKVIEVAIDGWTLNRPRIAVDERGSFISVYKEIDIRFVKDGFRVRQVNYTHTSKCGTVRGLHVQLPPYGEDKLVTCVKGAAFDVAVDLRVNSPTFGRWSSAILNSQTADQVFIPRGCAHGIQSLQDDTCLIYAHSGHYRPHLDLALHPMDPQLDIKWPLPPTGLSDRDQEGALHLRDFEKVQW